MKLTKLENTLKSRIRDNKLTLGSWITLGHPAIAEIMTKAGFDWLTIDLEHSVITIREAEELIRVIRMGDGSAFVRLTSNDPHQIKRVMDAGASGIIVPMVTTPDEAFHAVQSVRYPPLGKRGVGLARAQAYGVEFEAYKEWLENESIIIVQIEHINAVDNLEAILSVENIDGYIIGPYDLSASMGIPGQFEHPDFQNAMERIKKVSKIMNVTGGIHIIEPDTNQLDARIKEGFNFIAYSLDIRMLDVAGRMGIEYVKKLEK